MAHQQPNDALSRDDRGIDQHERAARERAAYDEGEVFETSSRWQQRFRHVFHSPNSNRMESTFAAELARAVNGKRVLELGCGDGRTAEKIQRELGAGYVLGVDIAETFVAKAQERARPGVMEFLVRDAVDPIEGTFDAIVGRAVLHHIDYRSALRRLYDENLAPGGAMIFVEPLGGHPLIRIYTKLVPAAHTSDERSFFESDLAWFESAFDDVQVFPFNYATLAFGIVSSRIMPSPDNFMLRAADRFDTWLANRSRRMRSQFRQAVLVIRKPV